MENTAAQGAEGALRHILAAPSGDASFLAALRHRGIEAHIEGELPAALREIAGGRPFVVVAHRSGGADPLWSALLPRLRDSGAAVIIERNIFGYVDQSAAAAEFDLICCNSFHTLWRHWRASGSPRMDAYLERHRVLYNALKTAPDLGWLAGRRQAARARFGIDQDAFVVGDICRPDPGKFDTMMLDILPRVQREIPSIVFLCRSLPTSVRPRIPRAVDGHVVDLPPTTSLDELYDTYTAMDVFVHMSTMGESFGMAVAEAMQCGLPVIANETPGSRRNNAQLELIEHGTTGYLASDAVSLARRLAELAGSPARRVALGAAGREKMAARPFAPGSAARQIESEVQRIASKLMGGGEAEARLPSSADVRAYLEGYRDRVRWRASGRTATELIWSLKIGGRRATWRLMRKREQISRGWS